MKNLQKSMKIQRKIIENSTKNQQKSMKNQQKINEKSNEKSTCIEFSYKIEDFLGPRTIKLRSHAKSLSVYEDLYGA